MTDFGHQVSAPLWQRMAARFDAWRLSRIASAEFQRKATRFWLTRAFARRDAARLYDLVAGFVYSQTLLAAVELGVLRKLQRGPSTPEALAQSLGLSADRAIALCQAAAAIGLLTRLRDGSYRLGRLGAAALGVPGLEDMIRHHRTFYRDLRDPVGLLRGETETELSRFWPYVLGTADQIDPETAETYSELMATSQHLVAEETLDAINLGRVGALADIGGGTGVFLEHVARRYPEMALTLFDLTAVAEAAARRLVSVDLDRRIRVIGGHFLEDPLPTECDGISLIRVLYDHDDATVQSLLSRVYAQLPVGGQVIVSEPMSGGDRPCRAGDAYFGFYTMAMTSGRPRAPETHIELLRRAGFRNVRERPTRRPFLTRVVTGRKTEH